MGELPRMHARLGALPTEFERMHPWLPATAVGVAYAARVDGSPPVPLDSLRRPRYRCRSCGLSFRLAGLQHPCGGRALRGGERSNAFRNIPSRSFPLRGGLWSASVTSADRESRRSVVPFWF